MFGKAKWLEWKKIRLVGLTSSYNRAEIQQIDSTKLQWDFGDSSRSIKVKTRRRLFRKFDDVILNLSKE